MLTQLRRMDLSCFHLHDNIPFILVYLEDYLSILLFPVFNQFFILFLFCIQESYLHGMNNRVIRSSDGCTCTDVPHNVLPQILTVSLSQLNHFLQAENPPNLQIRKSCTLPAYQVYFFFSPSIFELLYIFFFFMLIEDL